VTKRNFERVLWEAMGHECKTTESERIERSFCLEFSFVTFGACLDVNRDFKAKKVTKIRAASVSTKVKEVDANN
jgi:hypothetical protein